jgi:Spy/CpxP family protein refolding chaperone
MRRFYGYGVFAAALVAGLSVMVAAQPPAGGQGMRGQGQGMRGQGMGPGGGPMAALKLTAEQQEQLRALMQTERQTHQPAMEQVRELRKQLHETIYGGSRDESTALALAAEIASIEAKARIHMQMAAAAILTADQRKIVIESGIEFPAAQMGPGGMRGGRDGQGMGKKWN